MGIQNKLPYFLLLCFLSGLNLSALGQGVRGTVRGNDGQPLPYATIYFPGLNLGASSNEQGRFEIKLPQGQHLVQVQYVGYEKVQKHVEVRVDWVEIDFELAEQTLVLGELQIRSRNEDPAYTIMRKAIAKRKYHLLQYDAYEVKVYMKGTGELNKAPFFLKKRIEKEGGIKLNEAYTTEAVTEVKFRQPNTIEERIISFRTSGEIEEPPSPNLLINQSFYQDKIITAVSPLAGSAFVYYRFQYEGNFREGDITVNKIKVTPRSRGENVFEGYIYIMDDLWAIHSLDLKTSFLGFEVGIQADYSEITPRLWMPVTQRLDFSGKAFGFAGNFRYLASLSDYKVELNEDLIPEVEVVDENIEDVPKDLPQVKEKAQVAEVLEAEDKMSRKQFRKMINQYEKEALKESKEPNVISDRSYTIDSLATKRDSAYWAEVRPIPLTPKEIKGYIRDDSVARVRIAKVTGRDSANVIKKGGFKFFDLLIGGSYNLSPRTSFRLRPTIFNTYFNTVEGFNINLSGTLKYEFDSLRRSFEATPVVRYGFSSEDLYGKLRMAYSSNRASGFSRITVEGGRFGSQFNEDEPIHPHINTLSSLLFKKHYMKLFEKQYVLMAFEFATSDWLIFNTSVEWAQRQALFNTSDYSVFYRNRDYWPNEPVNHELDDTSFPRHEAFNFKVSIRYWPIKRYSIYNGNKRPLRDRSPELLLSYEKGVANWLGSDIDFDHLAAGLRHSFVFGVSGKLEFELLGGTFLNKNQMYFMDYKHFDGNRTILSSIRPAGAFRLLDYYMFSTNSAYFSGHTHYQFRKFLVTQLPEIRFSGIRENLFFNYLKTANSPHYYEVGYSIDRIFRLLRLEVAASFHDSHYREMGVRIGLATIFTIGD